MSTILDALKRVQEESDPQSLRDSVTQPRGRPPRRGRSGSSIFPLIALLLFAGVCAGAWFVWPGQETLLAYVPFGSDDGETAGKSDRTDLAATSPNSPAPSPQLEPGKRLTPQEREQLQKERRQRASSAQQEADRRRQERRAEATRLAAAAPPVVGEVGDTPPQRVATRKMPDRTRPTNNTSAPKVRPATPAPRRPASAPRASRDTAATTPVRSVTVRKEERRTEPLIDTGFALEAAPARSPGSAMAVVERTSDRDRLNAVAVESVRWHPDPKRREVTLVVDGSREVDAREGDVISGMLIHRIDPGTIEIHEGNRERLLSLLD